MVQASGANQASHYALIRALDAGTAKIDRWHEETVDKSHVDGHYYSVKAPGLAFATLPWFEAVDLTGLLDEAASRGASVARDEGATGGDERARLVREQRPVTWLLGLWAVVLPALALLLTVRWVAERFAPGWGTATAVVLGLGTLVLPYSTLLYAHLPAAALAFGSYALLLRGRWPVLAGLLGGLAVLVEYPVALLVGVLAVWTLLRSRRDGGLFVAGAALGVLPLALYNLWAFGSLTHMSYDDVVGFEGQEEGIFGVTLPDPGAAWDLLLSPRGLLVLTPVVAVAVWGLVRARRWELLAIVAVAFLYNAAYYLPFGGDVPGPRFLVPMLPFTAVGLAVALRERTALTLGLGAASVVGMVAATLALPQLDGEDTGRWQDLLADGDLQFTLLGALGAGHGWVGALPFLALVALAVVLAAKGMPSGSDARGGLSLALGVLAAWLLVALLAGDAPLLALAGAAAGAAAAVSAARSAPISVSGRSRPAFRPRS